MTRKEIEKRCREEMQQNIPDREALWQKIEANLPEQPVNQKSQISMIAFRRILGAAACFLLITVGLKFMIPKTLSNAPASSDAHTDYVEEFEDAADAELLPQTEFIKYSDLKLAQEKEELQINYQQLGTQEEYFNEDAILSKTEYFFDVKVIAENQDDTTGEMIYQLSVIHVLGGDREGESENSEITLRSHSAYVLKQDHEYILSLLYDQKNQNWQLSYTCAPQIEKTQDQKLIIPNGFYTLMQGETTPVLYDSYGKDDYFYDRMFLTEEMNLQLLIQKWETL